MSKMIRQQGGLSTKSMDCGSLLPLFAKQPAASGARFYRPVSGAHAVGLAAGLHCPKRQQAVAVHGAQHMFSPCFILAVHG